MLEIELDIFSGMPNPTWTLSGNEERELIERVMAEPAQLSPVVTTDEQFSLGYRGLIVRQVKSEDAGTIPGAFRVGSKPAIADSIADWLLGLSAADPERTGVSDELRAATDGGVALVQSATEVLAPGDTVTEQELLAGAGAHVPNGPALTGESAVLDGTWWNCGSNYFSANAAAFNDPAHVSVNNCYCFASNHLANVRYALPGRRSGHPATSITCTGVTAGLRSDGWQDGCQPNGLTIVLVIWPNYDYHFYRLVTGGPNWWWGHKPGGTPAKYTDDCGHAIYQENGKGYAPNNCCRGNYTDFCGYFYQNNSTAFVA